MKKIILSLVILAFSALQVLAVPAYYKAVTVKQADGSALLVRLYGDEHSHVTTTLDGYPLCFNAQSSNYEYATVANGELQPSGIIAANTANRNAEAKAFLQTIDKISVDKFLTENREASVRKAPSRTPNRVMKMNDVPTIGKRKALVILVNFSNAKFSMSNPTNYYDEFFHKEGFNRNGAQGCVYEWYAKGSNYLYDPEFDVYGPINLSGTCSDYAGGVNTVMSGLQDTYKMIIEAVNKLDDEVDFSQYDTDGDGVCDNVYCIYAGYSQADTGNQSYIWPHSGNLTYIAYTEQGDYSFYADGVKIDRYTVSSEMNGISDRPVGIGTFVHEFGHVLGLADHYNNGTGGQNQPGNWDVMARGCYNNDQNTPPLFTAFERYSLGWMDLTELDLKQSDYIDVPSLEDNVFAYRVGVPNKDNEYFIIENRQQKGWDKYIPGHGALVWHIEEDQSLWDANMPNGTDSHQRVDVVEADKRTDSDGRAYDTFPGAANITSFTFNDWNKNEVFAFAHVKEENGVAKLLLDGTDYKLQTPKLSVGTVEGVKASVSWNQTDITKSYNVQLLKGEEKVLSVNTPNLNYTFTDLQPETEYTVRVWAVNGKLTSEVAETQFITLHLQVYEQDVVALPATDITETGFTANWQAIDVAENYDVTLYVSESAGEKETGTGFDDYSSAEDLPAGWETNATTTPNQSYFGENAPSFRFNADGTYLLIKQEGSTLSHLRFWHRSNNGGNSVSVEQLVDGTWQKIGEDIVAAAGVEATENIDLDNAEAVRLVYHHNLGYFLLDDVYVTHGYSTFNSLKTVSTTDNFYTFTGLEAGKLYGYSVIAKAGGKTSGQSELIVVKEDVEEPDGIADMPTFNHQPSAILYDLLGRRILTVPQKGVCIMNGKKIMK